MSTAVYERIRKNPKFDELVGKRSRFAWLLTAVVLGIYFIFIMVVAFNPTLLATPIWEGGKASIAWPIGAGHDLAVLADDRSLRPSRQRRIR
jgi:uncharacterized membrane protein (DUF485 family)